MQADDVLAAPLPSAERLETSLNLFYDWGYGDTRARVRELYAKAKESQWKVEDVLPWSSIVDPGCPIGPEVMSPLWGTDVWRRMSSAERERCHLEINTWTVSQFLHGEQGALLAAAQLVDAVTDLDSKLYSATQVVDEARHVEVYDRYLKQKVGRFYPPNPPLKQLLDLVLTDSRWDMKFLGMQIVVEGLALASLSMVRNTAPDPLLREIARYVMADEARHVAFGLLSVRDYYADQSPAFRQEREDFLYESCCLARDRFLFKDVWEAMGLPVETCMEIARKSQAQVVFRQQLFSKVVPIVKRIGLLSERQRQRFAELGILRFEDASDPFFDLGTEEIA
jgi:hypothetical protein